VPDSETEMEFPGRIPVPPHRMPRIEPLPWQQPKPIEDDRDVQKRLDAILASPAYRQSDHDVEFLERPDLRGVRLQIDYLKPELVLEEHGVQRTIVVFGSTRIEEPAAAQRRLQSARSHLAERPDDPDLRRRLAVAERLEAKSRFYTIAREFGRIVGEAGRAAGDLGIVLATGGGPGMMEAANRGSFDVGAQSIGFNITLPNEQYPNPYLSPELSFRFHYFALRKLHFILRAQALVAFPGGYGTFDELFGALTLMQTEAIKPLPVVLVGREYWEQAFDVDFLIEEGVIDPDDRELFWFAESAAEIWNGILSWHEMNGTPLIGGRK